MDVDVDVDGHEGFPPDPNPSDGSEFSEDNAEEDDYASLLRSLAKDWVHTQLSHHVSITGANAFWNLAFKYVFKLTKFKKREGIRKSTPQFLHMRKLIYKDTSPEVKMSFSFLKKSDGSIHHITEGHTPLSQYERDPQYQKLYEEAHIKVNIYNRQTN